MKKNFLLTMVLALFCTATAWAQTAVTDLGSLSNEKAYVFYSTRSPLCYNSDNRVGSYWTANGMETQGGRLDVTSAEQAFALIRTANTEAGKYYMYSISGQKFVGSNNVASKTPVAVVTLTPVTYNSTTCFNLSIDGQKVNVTWWSNNAPGIRLNNGADLDEGNALTLYEAEIADLDLSSVVAAVEEYETPATDPYVLLKSPSGTYLSFTLPTPATDVNTKISFQTEGTKLIIEQTDNGYTIKEKDTENYLAKASTEWDVTTSTTPYYWLISEPDGEGYVTITKADNSSHRLGHDDNTRAGTGVFANVGDGCNKWLIEEYNFGAVTYTFEIERPTGETVSATYNGNAIAAGATIDIEGTVNTALFFANEITGYAWKVVVNTKAKKITLVYEKKYALALVNAPNGITVAYNGTTITEGEYTAVNYDSKNLSVTGCPNGYTWEVTRDDVNKIVTITFSQLQGAENPQAVVDLLNRIGGAGTADKFKIVLDPSLNYAADQFSINGEGGKILIKGTTISAITTGIGWYLQNIARINIAWNSLNEKTVSGAAYADLSNIPVPTGEEVHTSDAQYRYYLNTCTFGYSMTSWTWKRWQQEIDWMALHGINMPLQLVGMEEVWRKFLTMEENGKRKYGYTDEAAKAFVAGPAFIAWWAMNNLEGWGGTAAGTKSGGTWEGAGGVQDDAWYARQKKLAKQICDRQRELGMQPVLPGWSGMVPTNFKEKSGYATRANGGNWAGDFVRPLLLAVSNSNYAEIAADYYACLKEVMGESKYYSMDPFHEGGGAGTMEDYQALYAAMEAAKPGSQWVIQQWQWSATQRYSLTAVPAGRLIVLDLFSDGSPAFNSYNGYDPQDAVFCAIPNFGGRSGLMGRLQNVTDNYFKFKGQYSSIKGIGTAPEAIEQTPVTYDLIYQLPWMGTKPDVAAWVDNYAVARYGVDNEEIKEAWSLLRQGPLNYGADGIQGPVEDVWAARPNLSANHASYWGKTLTDAMGTYNTARQQMLIDATYKLLAHSGDIKPATIYESNYLYDIVEFGGGVMADYAYYLLKGIKTAKNSEGTNGATYIARRNAFLQLILDMDAFRGTNLNFRLGKWTQEARAAAAEAVALGATSANADWYEYNNARTILSTWSSPNTNLTDYSYRSWQGLMKDLYYPRWKHYFDNNCPDNVQYGYFEWNWAHGKEHYVGQGAVSNTALTAGQAGHTDSYTRDPEGNTITEANKMLAKYIVPVNLPDGTTYYAYRCLANDPSIKIVATEGDVLDLRGYFNFGNLDGLTVAVTSDVIDGTATDLSAVAIKADACGGADSVTKTATLALSDGTTITFTIVVNTSAMTTAKADLAALIEDMKELTAQVGTFDPAGVLNEVTLTTTQGSNGYIWTNAQSAQEGPLANLIDGDTGTHFHTNYSGGNATSGTHYIAVDLGEGTVLGNFKFDYTTRNGGSGDFPDKIVLYGCDDNSNYVKIAEITEPAFPQSTNTKWELGEVLYTENRYLRFNVYAERGYWHMSEFNIYRTSATAEVLDKYNGTELTNEFAAEKYNVLLDAINEYDYGTTTSGVTAAKEALQAAYDELQEKMDIPESPEHPDLTALIGELDALINKVAVKNADANVIAGQITLTITEGMPGYIWTNAQEDSEGPIENLIDNNNDTHFHTEYSAEGKIKPEGYHFVEIDLGENNKSTAFSFWYITRDDAQGGYPKGVEVMGSNDKQNYTSVYTVSAGLPQSAGAEYTSSPFDTKVAYRYLRFKVVTDAIFWHMGEFKLYNVKVGARKDYTTLRNISNDEVADAYTALQAAIATNASGSADEKQTAFENLTTIYDALNAKLQYLPEGVYNINYSGVPVFVGYSTDTSGNSNTAGYKLIDPASNYITEVAQADKMFIITHNGSGYSLSAQNKYLQNPHHDGWHHIMFTDDEAQKGKYMFEKSGDVYKLFSAVDNNKSANYVNDYGNVFGNDQASKDGLSTFTLTQVTEYSLNVPASGATTLCLPFNVVLPQGVEAYDVTIVEDNGACEYELVKLAGAGDVLAKNTPVVIMADAGDYSFDITMSNENARGSAGNSALKGTFLKTTVGETGFNYFPAISSEGELVFNLETDAATAVAANTAWVYLADNKGNVIVDELPETPITYPEVGKVYRIKNYTVNTPDEYKYHYIVNSNLNIAFPTSVENGDKGAMWVCTSAVEVTENENITYKCQFVSALGTAAFGWQGVSELALEYTISAGTIDGTVTLGNGTTNLALTTEAWNNRGNAAFNQASNGNKGQEEHWSTDWYLDKVENADVKFSKLIPSGNSFATIYLPYDVEIPAGVYAYYAGEIVAASQTSTKKVIDLRSVDEVIPKNTAVLLYRENKADSETFDFALSTGDAEAIVGNLFEGKVMTSAVEAPVGFRVFLLLNYNEKEAFYWMAPEYNDSLQAGGTHVKCDANKAYMKIDTSTQPSSAASYSFRFDGTTGIEEIEDVDNVESGDIYDLQGRKVTKPVKGGIYIKNGVKVIM